MASLIIENVSEELLESIEERARAHGRSLEEEVKRLLDERYRKRRKVLERIRSRRPDTEPPAPDEIHEWVDSGRP